MVGGNGRQLPANGSNRMGKLALKMAFRNTSHTHFAEGRNENSAIQNAQNIENRKTFFGKIRFSNICISRFISFVTLFFHSTKFLRNVHDTKTPSRISSM